MPSPHSHRSLMPTTSSSNSARDRCRPTPRNPHCAYPPPATWEERGVAKVSPSQQSGFGHSITSGTAGTNATYFCVSHGNVIFVSAYHPSTPSYLSGDKNAPLCQAFFCPFQKNSGPKKLKKSPSPKKLKGHFE